MVYPAACLLASASLWLSVALGMAVYAVVLAMPRPEWVAVFIALVASGVALSLMYIPVRPYQRPVHRWFMIWVSYLEVWAGLWHPSDIQLVDDEDEWDEFDEDQADAVDAVANRAAQLNPAYVTWATKHVEDEVDVAMVGEFGARELWGSEVWAERDRRLTALFALMVEVYNAASVRAEGGAR